MATSTATLTASTLAKGDAAPLQGTEVVRVISGGVAKQCSMEDISDYITSAGVQAADADLTAIAALASTGIAVRTASNTWAQRSLANAAAGLTWTNPAGVAGDPTPVLANDLAALEGLGSTGFAVRSASDTWVQRSVAVSGAGLSISDGSGVSGNPTISLADDIAAIEALAPSNDDLLQRKAGVWTNRTIAQLVTDISATNTYQLLDSDLTSWAGVTRASGFDTFAATPSLANLGSLLTDEATGLITFMTTPSSANLRALLTDEAGTGSAYFTGGALGTPASGTLSSCTGLPVSTGISGLGTGVATALAVNVGSAGAFVTFNGALGTPSSGTLTSCTGLPSIIAANEATDTTCFPAFFTATTGELGPKTNASFTFNSNTAALGVTSITVGSTGLTVGASAPFSDSAGTLTLQNVDALDATTESTIEAAIDTCANLVSIQGRTVTLADAGFDVILGWDDSGSAYKNFALADLTDEGTPAAGDYILIYGAEGDLRRANWNTLPGVGGGISNVSEDTSPSLGGALDGDGFDIIDIGVLTMREQAAAEADVAGLGQWWVQTATPNLPMFTNDAGTDFQLATLTGTETLSAKTFVAPALGTPASGVLSSCTGYAQSALTGLGANVSTFLGTPSYTNLAAALTGSVLKTAGVETIFVPAGAMVPRTTNGAAPGITEMASNRNMFKTLDFDTTTQEFAQFVVRMPKSWNEGTVTFAPVLSHASGSGNVVFGLAGVACSNDDAGDVAFGTPQTSDRTIGTANDIYIGPTSSAITIAGSPAAEDLVMFQVNRTVASDNLGVDARLHGITLYITTDATNDA
jgi:hypothetical protein